MEWWNTGVAAFALVFVAELGDKTQLLCLTLSRRYRPVQVWLAASAAFLLLNAIAVALGASLQHLIPRPLLAVVVALMFLFFAWRSWRDAEEDADDAPLATARGAFFGIFALIFVGELGDKTQLAVAGLAVTQPPLPVWLGASVALSSSAALAAFVGARVLKNLAPRLVHRTAAVLFAAFAVAALVMI